MEYLLEELSKVVDIAIEQKRVIGILVTALERIRREVSLPLSVELIAREALEETGHIENFPVPPYNPQEPKDKV